MSDTIDGSDCAAIDSAVANDPCSTASTAVPAEFAGQSAGPRFIGFLDAIEHVRITGSQPIALPERRGPSLTGPGRRPSTCRRTDEALQDREPGHFTRDRTQYRGEVAMAFFLPLRW